VLYDLMGTVPSDLIEWLLESETYRWLPRGLAVRQAVSLTQTIAGDEAIRERMRMLLATTAQSVWRRLSAA
jgi:hypothetical protein